MTQDNGTYIRYRDIKFTAETLEVIHAACRIIKEYETAGYALTLRQLYYQFVARDLLANKQSNYDRLGGIVSDGRLAGLISWTAIEDRARNLQGLTTFDGPAHCVRSAAAGYRIDMWANQDFRPEVWIEKDALTGVISGICNKLRVDFFACKGYNSQSEQWRAGRRFADYYRKGQRPIVFHLGDHDPSGIDMTRDNQERLSMFAGTQVMVQRLALNMSQIEELRPPPNPVKMTDSRQFKYVEQFGYECWELDALSPDRVEALIEDAVLRIRNHEAWDEALRLEAEDRRVVEETADMMKADEDEREGD